MRLPWRKRSEPVAPRVKRKPRWKLRIAFLLLLVCALLYLNSGSFSNSVRRRVITTLEDMTGGRVELAGFSWSLFRLEIEARDLTIHGLEPAGEVPYFHVDRLQARLKIWSLFGREIGLREVLLEHPVAHIMVFPDGSTNQPAPKDVRPSSSSAIEQLFSLRVGRCDIRQGMLLWNDKRIPLDLSGNDLSFQLGHHFASSTYNGELSVGKLHAAYGPLRPFDSSIALAFALRHAELEVKSLQWSSEGSRLEAKGTVHDFQRPTALGTYSATIDLKQAGGIVQTPALQGGKVEVQGKADYRPGSWSSEGHLFAKDGVTTLAFLRLTGVSAGANFILTSERLDFENILARALDGSATGSAQVRGLWGPQPLAGKKRAEPTAEVHLKVQGAQLAALSHSLSTTAIQPEPLHLAGATSGTVDLVWKGRPLLLHADYALNVAAPAQPLPNQKPVNGVVHGSYDEVGSRVQFAESSVATPATHASAHGAIGARDSRLDLSVEAADLGEMKQILTAMRIGDGWMPTDPRGRGAFQGQISGTTLSPELAGHVELSQFTATLPASVWHMGGGASPVRTFPLRADSLSGELHLTPTRLQVDHAQLHRNDAAVTFDLSAQLQRYRLDDKQPIALHLAMSGVAAEELERLAGMDLPVSGAVALSLRLNGTMRNPSGNGNLRVTDGVAYGQTISLAYSDFQVDEGAMRFSDLQIEQPSGSRTLGSGSYNFDNDAFAFDLTGSGFHLSEFPQLQSAKVQLDGLANFNARGSGTLQQPVVNADFHLRDLLFNGEPVGTLDATAVTIGRDLDLKARSHFQNASAVLDGAVRLEEPYQANVKLQLSQVDMDPLLRAYTSGKMRGHSAIAGTMTVQGPLERWRELHVVADFDQALFDVEGVKLRNQGPIRLSLADQVLHLEQLHVVGEDTDLSASGTTDMRGDRALALRADGRMNLKLLQSFNPDIASYGHATMSAQIGGSVAQPRWSGQVQIEDAGLSFIDLPNGLSGINGVMIFNQNRLQIQSLTARTGGGDLKLGGYVAYSNGLYFNLTGTGQDIRLRYPPGLSAVATADLRFVGTTRNSLLSGDVVITRFGLNPRFDFAEYLARTSQTATIPNPDSPLTNLRLDVHVTSTPELQVQTSLAKLSADADLRIRGTFLRPVVLGRVNIHEGDIVFNGTKYHLERGDVTFTNPVHIEPVLDLEATARIRDIDITLGFHGSTDKLATTYRSDPPLPTADIIALLALGRTREDTANSTAQSQAFTETASNAILSEALNATISNRVKKIFGVSRVQIDPQVGGPESNPNARLTVEQQVSDHVTLTYITNLSQSAQQVIQVEFTVNKFVSIVAVRDQNGVVSLEAKYKQRIR